MTSPTGKRCSRCGAIRPLDAFGRNRTHSDGLRGQCRECERADRVLRRDEIREQVRRSRKRNREQRRAYNTLWRERNPDKVREQRRRADRGEYPMTGGTYCTIPGAWQAAGRAGLTRPSGLSREGGAS